MTRPTKTGSDRKPSGDFTNLETRQKFLDSLSVTMNQSKSCAVVGISYQRVHDVRKADPEFDSLCLKALSQAMEYHENILRERAFFGTKRNEYHKGEVCGEYQEYDNGTCRWLLQVYNREKYCVDKQDINLKHSGGVLIIPPGEGSVEGWMEKNAMSMEQSSEDDIEEEDK